MTSTPPRLVFGDPLAAHVAAVLRGDDGIPPLDRALAEWITATYGVPVVTVTRDETVSGTPRLCVWVRTRDGAERFRDGANYDATIQAAIAARAVGPARLLVIARAFDPIAVEAALSAVPAARWTELGDAPEIWKLEPFFGRLTVFLQTEEQVAAFTGSDAERALVGRIRSLVAEYDEFGVAVDGMHLVVDSRYTYEVTYRGNGYNYYR